MPCYDGREQELEDREQAERRHQGRAMELLCRLMKPETLEESLDGRITIEMDKQLMTELIVWWFIHKKRDEERAERNAN